MFLPPLIDKLISSVPEFVRVADFRTAGANCIVLGFQFIRQPEIIRVQKGDVITFRCFYANVSGMADPPFVVFRSYIPDKPPHVGGAECGSHGIIRAVINHDYFIVTVRLAKDRFDSRF